jgi:hypothetical protein
LAKREKDFLKIKTNITGTGKLYQIFGATQLYLFSCGITFAISGQETAAGNAVSEANGVTGENDYLVRNISRPTPARWTNNTTICGLFIFQWQ